MLQTNKANATRLTVGEWTWTDCGDDLEPALQLESGFGVRAGYTVNAAYLRRLRLDLMKRANLVAQRP